MGSTFQLPQELVETNTALAGGLVPTCTIPPGAERGSPLTPCVGGAGSAGPADPAPSTRPRSPAPEGVGDGAGRSWHSQHLYVPSPLRITLRMKLGACVHVTLLKYKTVIGPGLSENVTLTFFSNQTLPTVVERNGVF